MKILRNRPRAEPPIKFGQGGIVFYGSTPPILSNQKTDNLKK